ncbi:phage baseplate plug family protein [Klebsiella pneumoniae]
MSVSEIPLAPDSQSFNITLAGVDYQMRVVWRGVCWFLDLMDSTGSDLIKGIPLITGADLLAQYRFLGLGFSLYVVCDDPASENPTQFDLGINSHLYAETEE